MKFKRHDIQIDHVRGSGPGGQNRNKRWSGVRVTHLSTGIVVTATERRSQIQNLEMALTRLGERLRALLEPRRPRIPTKKTKSADVRRLTQKQHRSSKKQRRRFQQDD